MKNSLFGVIDIGSNSVRLMLSDGVNALSKENVITRIAEGQGEDSMLKDTAIERTALAVSFYANKAKTLGADKILIFATAAVRKAKNKSKFLDRVKELCGITVDVVSGEKEADIGFLGAAGGIDGGVIDIGGASSEIIVKKSGKLLYSKSLNVGCVSINNDFGQDKDKIEEYLNKKIEEYGEVPLSNFYAIGGTATSLCAIAQDLKEYSKDKVDGFLLSREQVDELVVKLSRMTISERKDIPCLQKGRGEVILGGAILLSIIMKKLGINYITVSEKDNLEGYLKDYLENL